MDQKLEGAISKLRLADGTKDYFRSLARSSTNQCHNQPDCALLQFSVKYFFLLASLLVTLRLGIKVNPSSGQNVV